MSVRKDERKDNRFQLPLKARQVAAHTLQITSNKNVFPVGVAEDLQKEVNQLAMNIYANVKTANDIDLFKHREQRKKYQLEAYHQCIKLIALIDLTIPVYHFEKKRARFWCDITVEVRDGISKWIESDNRRYKESLAK